MHPSRRKHSVSVILGRTANHKGRTKLETLAWLGLPIAGLGALASRSIEDASRTPLPCDLRAQRSAHFRIGAENTGNVRAGRDRGFKVAGLGGEDAPGVEGLGP